MKGKLTPEEAEAELERIRKLLDESKTTIYETVRIEASPLQHYQMTIVVKFDAVGDDSAMAHLRLAAGILDPFKAEGSKLAVGLHQLTGDSLARKIRIEGQE